ncbi:MAG TPA: 4,5-DOPA dioxygenase extradiol [Rhodocyclaceae bacterium]|nr:4,5-DOPA dioxygenase extradiol [Rhodocyclaceae bacterium]
MTNTTLPALFLGHGTPMNTLADNRYTQAWRGLGLSLPRPRAILAVSAHWYLDRVAVTAMAAPETIHDFGGFPQALYDIRYPAPGSPPLAARVIELLSPLDVAADQDWGLDHGTWSVLAHAYPDADIPVVQLAVDRRQPARFHYELGRRLAPLRKEGILIVGSGNVVHNLRALRRDAGDAAHAWAERFERAVMERLRRGDHDALIDYQDLDPEALLAVPTPEHYLPLLYAIGAMRTDEEVSLPSHGIDMASLSMLSVLVGI